MKNFKKAVALLLAVLLLSSCLAAPAYAGKIDPGSGAADKFKSYLYMALDKLVSTLVSVLNRVIPGLEKNWPALDSLKPSENFYPGESGFDAEVGKDAEWSAGYASDTLLSGLEKKGDVYLFNGKKVYMAGSLEPVKGRQPTGVIDDQRVCTYALSDGTGGTVVHAVIDGYGIASGDVLEIRSRLADFARENGIISINVSVLHQHSCIDILGMGAPLVAAVALNPFMSLSGADRENFVGGKTPEFMENLYSTVASTVTEAVKDMKTGSLYYGSADVSEYIYDKRDPKAFDPEIHRLRFVPDDESENELWICEGGIHAVGAGISSSRICSDYPYYLRETVKEQTGADVVYVQGAELAVTADYGNVEYDDSIPGDKVRAMGKKLAERIISINNDEPLEPVLNIAMRNVYVKATNEILKLAAREGLISTTIARKGSDYYVVTELGYMELGNRLGVIIVPGEISPELLWGGVIEKDKTWTGKSWDYEPFEKTAKTQKLLCFGLANDQIGYILPDNDYRSMFTENEEINAVSSEAASTLAKAFEALISEVK